MPGKDQVGGGLPLPGVGIEVAAQQPPGLSRHQGAAVVRLAHRLVGGGQVEDQSSPVGGQGDGGRHRGPQILADLHTDDKLGHRVTLEELVLAQENLLAAEGQAEEFLLRGGLKPTFLIEFAVVGQVGLGHQTQQLPMAEEGGTVVELAPGPHGQANRQEEVQLLRSRQHLAQGLLRPAKQGVLQKQVAAGVAGQAQLRQAQHLDALLCRLAHKGNTGLGVVGTVGHPDFRGAYSHFDKSVPHVRKPPLEVNGSSFGVYRLFSEPIIP